MHCPLKEKRIKGSLPEWISSDYIKLSKDRDHYYSKAHKTNDPQDWLMAKNLRNQVNILKAYSLMLNRGRSQNVFKI